MQLWRTYLWVFGVFFAMEVETNSKSMSRKRSAESVAVPFLSSLRPLWCHCLWYWSVWLTSISLPPNYTSCSNTQHWIYSQSFPQRWADVVAVVCRVEMCSSKATKHLNTSTLSMIWYKTRDKILNIPTPSSTFKTFIWHLSFSLNSI